MSATLHYIDGQTAEYETVAQAFGQVDLRTLPTIRRISSPLGTWSLGAVPLTAEEGREE